MRKPKIVILRGRPTSGKSTAWNNLMKRKEMKDWLFVDHANLKTRLGKDLGKESLFAILKIVMKTKKDIMVEETSRDTLLKFVSKEIKKYGYQIVVFQFTVRTETAYKRDVRRAKDNWHPFMGKKWIDETHKMHDDRFDKKGILVDTNKLGKRKVVEFILDKLK
jgi:predicted kinase